VVGIAMAAVMWGMASIGAVQIASTVPALAGCALLWLIGRRYPPDDLLPPGKMAFHLAFLPYYVLIVMTVATQLGPLAALTRQVAIGFDFPASQTALGYAVQSELGYPRLRILAHPVTIILLAIAFISVVYRAKRVWPDGTFQHALRLTYRRSIVSSTAVTFMVMTALVMTDSGMARAIADGIRTLAGPAFPMLSPFIGVIGAFMTGSNTNSNIMMGALQVETAVGLGIAPVLIAAAQTVGGSLGSGISPDKSVIGATVAGVQGNEGRITRTALPYGLIGVTVVGLQVLILAMLRMP
jgi:lactate permease